MSRMIGRLLTAAAVLAIGSSPVAAQRLHADTSLGGVITGITRAGGLYLDVAQAVLPTTSAVGEMQVFQSNATEFVALGGVRQLLARNPRGELYAQFLLGVATGYSRRCDLCHPRTTEFGLGANVRLNDRWAVRVRGDIRVGGSAADLFYPTVGGGITRRWG